MGGKALSVPGVRLNRRDYSDFEKKIEHVLHVAFPDLRFAVIPAYREKPDFGDLDLLYCAGSDPLSLADAVGAKEVVRNGPVTSVGVPVEGGLFQVDFVSVPPESFDFALHYFGFNDLGNLIGRIAHAAGFKLGHLGLRYVVRDPLDDTRVIREIEVTRNWDVALSFLHYDPDRYHQERLQGFRTLEDIYRFSVSTSYFDPGLYLLDNISHRMRVRDRKRPTYTGFLKWLQDNRVPASFQWQDKTAVRARILRRALDTFPCFACAYKRALKEAQEKRALKEVFNGKLVSEWTELEGKALGRFMAQLKDNFDTEEQMRKFILDLDDVRSWVIRIYESQA